METKQLITRSMAHVTERNFNRFQMMQRRILLDEWNWNGLYDFVTIEKTYLCPEEIIMPYNKDYIILAFDYEPIRTGMEIVRIPDRYNTTHFKEKISLN